jgi:hypothetical protein
MAINSRSKGKRGELEAAKFLRERGVPARRGQQFKGGGDSPDVASAWDDVHIEVKRVEIGNPYLWLEQAIRDAGPKLPIVMHKRNLRDWIVVMRAEDFIQLKGVPYDDPRKSN